MPFETPDKFSRQERKILENEANSDQKSERMKEIFSNKEKYANFLKERTQKLERTQNETVYIKTSCLFDRVMFKYKDEIQKLTENSLESTTTTQEKNQKMKLYKCPANYIHEPVSLQDYRDLNYPSEADQKFIHMNDLLANSIRKFEIGKEGGQEGEDVINAVSLGKKFEDSLTKDEKKEIKTAMENVVKAERPLNINQLTRNLPGVKARFVNLVKAINNAYLNSAINIFAKKKGWDEATKQTKGDEIKKNFIAQMPSDEEFTQQYDELIHSISYITNETKKSGEESAAQWNNPTFNRDKIERYVEQAEDLYYAIAETDKPSYAMDAQVNFSKETFGGNDADLPFDQTSKRVQKVVEMGGEKITYYFSRSRVWKTEENPSGYVYNIERVSKNERVLLQVISAPKKGSTRGKYEGMIIQPVDANTTAYRQGKYEEYESYQRNTKVTNMMHTIKNEVMDIDLQNHI